MTHEARLVFLGGVGSGGTDLLMNVLNAHGEVFIPGEIPFLPRIADEFPALVPAERVAAVTARMRQLDEYRTLTHHHWTNFVSDRKDEVELGPPPDPRDGRVSLSAIYLWLLGVPENIAWSGNKTPTNTENMDRLARAFPDARFIVIVRDPRDVVMSWRRRWDRDERLTADKWERRLARGREHIAALPAGTVLVVRYEDLLGDLQGVSHRLCAFLELDFDPAMLRFHEHVTKTIGGQENRGRPLVAGNAAKWRTGLSPSLVERVEEIAWSGMHAHGYDVIRAQGPRPLTRLERARGRAQDFRSVMIGRSPLQRVNRRRAHARRIVLQSKKLLLHRDTTV
jgi:hypothetical protein